MKRMILLALITSTIIVFSGCTNKEEKISCDNPIAIKLVAGGMKGMITAFASMRPNAIEAILDSDAAKSYKEIDEKFSQSEIKTVDKTDNFAECKIAGVKGWVPYKVFKGPNNTINVELDLSNIR